MHVMVRRGGRALERGRGLSPGGAISKWEPPAMTSLLSVNHLCLISPPGALQSKYQCRRPTKTAGCIKRITQATRVLHHRGAGLIIRARRRDGGSWGPCKNHTKEKKKKRKNGRIQASVLPGCCGSGPVRCGETRWVRHHVTLWAGQSRFCGEENLSSSFTEVIHTQFRCSFHELTLIFQWTDLNKS